MPKSVYVNVGASRPQLQNIFRLALMCSRRTSRAIQAGEAT